MGKTNSLTSHHPERRCSRIDKMSGQEKVYVDPTSKKLRSTSNRFFKKFINKKSRQLLKDLTAEKI